VTTASATSATTATTTQSDDAWKHLQSEYSGFLGNKCDDQALDAPTYNACIGLQNGGLDSFERGANDLPAGKARADLLSTIAMFRDDYKKFTNAMCQVDKTQIDCIAPTFGIKADFDTLGTIVNREAGAP